MRSRLKQTGFFLLLTTIVFLVLYRRFLFGSAVYLYTDIGSDSISSSYPILVMLSRLFQNGDFSFYTLSSGLGADTTVTFLQYLNPLKAFLLLFSRNSMPIGILLQLYLQTLLTAWASYRFFDLYTGHSAASMGAALLFSYSSYAVLWSQNLSYGVCVAMFALTMFALEAFLRLRTLPRFLALTGVLALYLFTNYFFCYMTALFVMPIIGRMAMVMAIAFFPYARKAEVATAVGRINRHYANTGKNMLLMAPGRVGTSSPELGVPTRFADICPELSELKGMITVREPRNLHFWLDSVKNWALCGVSNS